ncbi:MAG: DUF2147 domain-containing protein [Acetobacteraceae bacterium]|nr:DUF2147 domain-containing protein [Acetobacteraceae bacterium]
MLWVFCICLPLCAAVFAGFPAKARELAGYAAPLGEWRTANGGGVIAISWCGEALCGRIVGIKRDPGEPMPTDAAGRSQCRLTIITNATPGQDGSSWFGQITDPRDDKHYGLEMWVGDDGRLHVRGYLGVPLLGQTSIWERFTGRITADCGIA